jgi:hypothetical protein
VYANGNQQYYCTWVNQKTLQALPTSIFSIIHLDCYWFPNKLQADLIINEWLAIWTSKFTHRDAQHSRKVQDRKRDLVEVIKYETKIFTEPDGKKSRGRKGTAKIYIRALDNINAAMKGCRLVDRFGFNLPKGSKKERQNCKYLTTI